jgi:hypothetical protein
MSINVEMIGKTLIVQHYVGEVVTPSLCRMVSSSDAFTPNGRTRVQVIWTLSLKRVDDQSCEYTNSVVAHSTAEFMEFIGYHNLRETPLFAASIARKALRRACNL